MPQVSRTLLKNATYLDERMRFRRADVLVEEGRIASLSRHGSLGNGDASESLDCSEMLVIPGLVNAHFHSQANLGRGLFRGMPISEWGDESSEQGRLQARFFDLVDSGLSAEETKTVCKKAYAELARTGVALRPGLRPGRAPRRRGNAGRGDERGGRPRGRGRLRRDRAPPRPPRRARRLRRPPARGGGHNGRGAGHRRADTGRPAPAPRS